MLYIMRNIFSQHWLHFTMLQFLRILLCNSFLIFSLDISAAFNPELFYSGSLTSSINNIWSVDRARTSKHFFWKRKIKNGKRGKLATSLQIPPSCVFFVVSHFPRVLWADAIMIAHVWSAREVTAFSENKGIRHLSNPVLYLPLNVTGKLEKTLPPLQTGFTIACSQRLWSPCGCDR